MDQNMTQTIQKSLAYGAQIDTFARTNYKFSKFIKLKELTSQVYKEICFAK